MIMAWLKKNLLLSNKDYLQMHVIINMMRMLIWEVTTMVMIIKCSRSSSSNISRTILTSNTHGQYNKDKSH